MFVWFVNVTKKFCGGWQKPCYLENIISERISSVHVTLLVIWVNKKFIPHFTEHFRRFYWKVDHQWTEWQRSDSTRTVRVSISSKYRSKNRPREHIMLARFSRIFSVNWSGYKNLCILCFCLLGYFLKWGFTLFEIYIIAAINIFQNDRSDNRVFGYLIEHRK